MRRCIREDETFDILLVCHDEPCGGHFAAKRITIKILNREYYCPTLHKDASNNTRKCDRYQRMGLPTKSDEMLLHQQVVVTPFDKWGMDFIGPIDPPSNGKSYNLVFTDYLTKWVGFFSLTVGE